MTGKGFRKLALALPETEERSHMNHPDFRVAGKIFATLGYPDKSRGMVKLSRKISTLFPRIIPTPSFPSKESGDAAVRPAFISRRPKKVLSPKRSKPPGATRPQSAFSKQSPDQSPL
jgi:hypothetical protein